MPAVLWTDALIYLLLVVVAAFALYARRHEHLRAPWREVARRRLGMVSLVVLLAYLLVGLLDSVHFRPALPGADPAAPAGYSVEVLSLLDLWLGPIRTQEEKTYSAPLAVRLYSRETVELADGSLRREYPRLRYGGAHLRDPDRERVPDLLAGFGRAGAKGLVAWLALAGSTLGWLAWRRGRPFRQVLRGLFAPDAVPWGWMLVTAGVLLLLGFVAAELGPRYHLLGTDKVGQDVLYQTLKSVRTGLVIGTLATLVMLPFAISLGVVAGYFGGWADDLIQYLYTTLNSIPGVLLIAASILIMQAYIDNHPELFETAATRADLRLLVLCIILGVTNWTGLCRLLRGEALKLREVDYVQAAVAFGVGHTRLLVRHILPNVMHIVLISVVLDFSALVLAEAVLSYVGVGVDPSANSWGNMINAARLEMAREPIVWWSLAAAFLFMFTLVLAANLFADAVRDAFDPRLRRQH